MPHATFRYPSGERRQIEIAPGEDLMHGAVRAGLNGLVGECGGVMTCATCHVHIAPEWLDRLPAPDFAETELLEMVEDLQPNSRLGCQIPMSDILDGIEIAIPPSNL